MTSEQQAPLIHLSKSDLELADPEADVRGRKVIERTDQQIGDVDDLVIDPEERRVRFLVVGAGGFLGIGEKKLLIPVEAITEVNDVVRIEQEGADLSGAPVYDPTVIEEPTELPGPLRLLRLPAVLGARLRLPTVPTTTALTPPDPVPNLRSELSDRARAGPPPAELANQHE